MLIFTGLSFVILAFNIPFRWLNSDPERKNDKTKRVKEELVGAKCYFDYKDRCIFCDMIRQELDEMKRVFLDMSGRKGVRL